MTNYKSELFITKDKETKSNAFFYLLSRDFINNYNLYKYYVTIVKYN